MSILSVLQQLERRFRCGEFYLYFEQLLNGKFNARTGSFDSICSKNIPKFHEERDMINSEIKLNCRLVEKVIKHGLCMHICM
jgi:hypothetical protein